MKRRRFITAIGTAILGTGTALGTGAFSTGSAERSFSVATANDQSGLLTLKSGNGAAASRIVNSTTQNSQRKTFDFGSNINDEAVFAFDSILEVINNSENDLSVDVLEFIPEDSSGDPVTDTDISDTTDPGSYDTPIGVYKANDTSGNGSDPFDSSFDRKDGVDNVLDEFKTNDADADLTPGDSVMVGFIIDTTGDRSISDIDTVNIVAKTSESGSA